jgi:serine/threonine-protein kinase
MEGESMAADASEDVSPLPKVTIHVARGRSSTTSREMNGRSLLLGSGPQCDIQMRSPDVAAKHALITRGADGVIIRPLDAEHPLIVNGSVAQEQELRQGDSIKLGPFELRVTIQEVSPQVGLPKSSPASTAWQSLARLTKRPESEPTPTFVPERLAEIQRSQAETDKDLERKRRQLQDELTKIESERAQFKQEKNRFDIQRQEIDRQLRDSAAREGDLARLAEDLENRQRRVIELEQQLEWRQNKLADDSIQFDHRLEQFEARKLHLLRVRRRLIEQYRRRFDETHTVHRDIAGREEKLRQDRAEHEAEVTHWKRVADELGRRQAELKRIEAEIQRRHEITERREQDLKDRQSRFENDIAQTLSKDKSLESLRADLERRKGLLAEEESSLREARKAVEDQFERAKARSGEIQKRHEEIEARRLTVEKQEQYLREQATALEKHRVTLVELDRDLAARQASVEQGESALLATRQHLESKDADLRIRELALTQSQELLANKEATLREWEGQKELDQRAIDKRLAELQKESSHIAAQIEEERRRLDEKRAESDQIYLASQRAKDEVEDERDRWLAKMNEAREIAAEVAHRESIVQARQRQIDSMEQRHAAVSSDMAAKQQTLENDRRLLDMDRTRIELESKETRDRTRVIHAEVARLRELSLELERRQQSLIDKESAWANEVMGRKSDWQKAAEEIAHKQQLLDRQAASQKQRVQKLRDLTSKLFGRSPRAEQKAESVREHHEAHVERIQSAHSSQHELLQKLLGEVELMDQQSTISNESLNQLRSELTRLAHIRESVARTMETSSAAGNIESLRQWQGELESALSQIENRSREIDAHQQQWASLPVPKQPLASPTPAKATANDDPWREILSYSDDDLADRLRPSNLLDANKITWLKQSAASRGSRLAEEIVRSRSASLFELKQIVQGKGSELALGPARITDRLHDGAVATTYLITMNGSDRPLAARMLKPLWSRDPARRREYEMVLDALKSFVHPNVVQVHGSLMAGERFGSLTEYVPSVSLEPLVGLPCPVGAVVAICHQSLSAIAFAERAGIAHLSLRPSRILISSGGQVQLLGFGEPDWLRRVHACERGRSLQQFASPEVLTPGQSVDSRADVYSIAAIASQMILQYTGANSLTDRSLHEEYPPAVLDLLSSMQDPLATGRPRAHEAVDVLQGMADPQSLMDWPDLAVRLEEFDRRLPGRRAA